MPSFFLCLMLILVNTFSEGIQLSKIEEPDKDIFQPNILINYVYYPISATWNEARTVCQNLGGDLAKINSRAFVDIIANIAFENYQTDIFSKEYWIGLVEMTEGNHFWVSDCSPLNFGENFPSNWKDNELCFRMRKDHTGERKNCNTNQGFLCQVETDVPCSYISRLDSQFLSMSTNSSDCKSECSGNVDCWATVEKFPDTCIMLATMDLGQGIFQMFSKFCLNVTLNTAMPVIAENNSYIPGHNCSNLGYTPVIVPTPSSTVVPSSSVVVVPTSSTLCPSLVVYSSISSICLTETSIITSLVTEHFSVPFNVTQTVSVTHTVYNTEYFNITLTNTQFSNITQTNSFTDTYTETIHSTSTEFYTVTLTVSSIEQNNFTTEQAEVIAKEFVKNLTVNSKSTGAHMRKLTSADDRRASVKYMGTVGIIAVVIPLAILLLPDLKNVFMHIRSHHSIYSRRQL